VDDNKKVVVLEVRYPFGETRWVSGTLPTDRLFTGQRVDSYSNIIEMGARWYSALLGRFLSSDSVVPRPGDSQAYNRYAYARNSPLTRIDPSGHADCAAGDNACWTNEWMWKNRWYEAHGSFWGGSGWSHKLGQLANFRDNGILYDVLSELGIVANYWDPTQLEPIAQGIVALANTIGWSKLRSLLPYQTAFVRKDDGQKAPWVVGSDACNCELGILGPIVTFYDSLFTHNKAWIRGVAVHELAHVMDFKGHFSSQVKDDFVIKYAFNSYSLENQFGIEFFAESVAAWVFESPTEENPYLVQTPGYDKWGPLHQEVINWLKVTLGVQP